MEIGCRGRRGGAKSGVKMFQSKRRDAFRNRRSGISNRNAGKMPEGYQPKHNLEQQDMEVVAFNGSARKDGNTAILIRAVLCELESEGIQTEFIQLSAKNIRGCIACMKCFEKKDKRCAWDLDFLNECVDRMVHADGIILGSPTYFANVSSEMKALIDRAGMVAKANSDMFRRKVGAAVVAVRRAGSIHAFDAMNHFFLIGQMIIPGSSYWNVGIGRDKGDVETDSEGLQTMRTLGRNMAWLLKKIAG
jgi:multimeric flavodoxin WrbA